MRLFLRAFVLAIVAAIAFVPTPAQSAQESHVWVNNTTDKWVWVTAFRKNCTSPNAPTAAAAGCTYHHIVHEWCVPPTANQSNMSKQGFHVELTFVHLLVTTHPNCGRPIIKDWTMDYIIYSGRVAMKHQYNITMHTKDGATSYGVDDIY